MIINGMYINRIVLVPQGQQKEKEPGTLQESDKRGEWHLKWCLYIIITIKKSLAIETAV